MTKTQIFENKRVHTPGMKYLDEYLTRFTGIFAGPHSTFFQADFADASQWRFDTFEQFIATYLGADGSTYRRANSGYAVEVAHIIDSSDSATMVTVRAPDRLTILKILSIIQDCLCPYTVKLPPQTDQPTNPPPKPTSKSKKTTSPKIGRDRKRPCRT